MKWEPLGQVVRTQIHTAEIVHDQAYDISRLSPVDSLHLTEAGVVGRKDDRYVLDYHHRDHPELRSFKPGRQLSVGFTGHYRVMGDRFGDVPVGVAAENIVVDHDGVLTEGDVIDGLRVEGADGSVDLIGAQVAKPCVPFTKFLLSDRPVAGDETIASYRASLDHGIRGFVMALENLESSVTIRRGDVVYRLVG